MDCRFSPRLSGDCRQMGFTLIEAIVVLVILCILTTLTIPAFSELIRNVRLGAQVSNFAVAYNLARSEAIKGNRKVLLCAPVRDECSADKNWSRGWVVFIDRNGDAKPDADELVRQFAPLPTGYRFGPNVKTVALVFDGRGQVRRQSGALPMATFLLCGPGADNNNIARGARELVVSSSGRMRVGLGRPGETLCP